MEIGPIGIALILLVGVAGAEEPLLPAEVERGQRVWEAAEKTVVVYNAGLPESVELAHYYVEMRGIPEENLVGLDCSLEETISRAEFEETIWDPLHEVFHANGWWRRGSGEDEMVAGGDRRILALMYGIPLRIHASGSAPDGQMATTAASIDSDLTMLGVEEVLFPAGMNNPYFGQEMRFVDFPEPGFLLVGRLDGVNVETVRRMIDDAVEVEKTGLWGRAYVDLSQDPRPGYTGGDQWLKDASKLLRAEGIPVVTERHQTRYPIHYPMSDAIIYLGWYANHCDGVFLNPGFRFAKGAVAIHIHSYSAGSLRDEDKHWVGPLLERGAAASIGNVWEPFLNSTTNLDLFTDRLLKGYTFVEAGWMATPTVSWMTVMVGDPLYRPFGKGRGLADRDQATAYKIAHLSSQVHQSEQPAGHLEEMLGAGVELNDGTLVEAVGLYVADQGSSAQARRLFEHAAVLYGGGEDQVRSLLHIADLYRVEGELDRAIGVLDMILSAGAGGEVPAMKAVKVLRDELDPPPPKG